jgi:4-aminobutyrate aminotransferase-like enzyme
VSCSPRQQSLIRRTFIDFQQTAEFLERPLIFDRAEGLYLWDLEGRRYFDATADLRGGAGHRPPRVLEAVWRQMDRLTFAPPLHGITEVALTSSKAGLGQPGEPQLDQGLQRRIGIHRGARAPPASTTNRPAPAEEQGSATELPRGTMAAMRPAAAKRKVVRPHAGFLKAFFPIQLGTASRAGGNQPLRARLFEEIINENPETAAVLVEPICNTGDRTPPRSTAILRHHPAPQRR